MNFAFTFDASACSGCKACQEACKDKNELPVGLLWRRVIEVTGGEWYKAGSAWENSVFAYNITLACNHCTHPKCAGVCPVDAYTVRPDGIVLLDSSRCMGCDYCAWACPYGAPQYDRQSGTMTKCDFCYDRLDEGMPPSCVAACPLRVLDYGTIEEMTDHHQRLNLWQRPASEHPFPLPGYSRTEPHLVIKPHAGMNSPLTKMVANQEELHPPGSIENIHQVPAIRDLPLVGFTLLTQAAAGLALFSLALSQVPLPVLLGIGVLLIGAGLISFLHLGRKRNAWRSVIHIKKSWLSREILVAGLFGAAWLFAMGSLLFGNASPNPWPMALLGVALIYCTARVYFLRAVPTWNSWRTPVSFSLSTVVLGSLVMRLVAPQTVWAVLAALGMLAELGLMLTAHSSGGKADTLRLTLLVFGIVGALLTAVAPRANVTWLLLLIFLAALSAEAIGRWQFYARRLPFLMSPGR